MRREWLEGIVLGSAIGLLVIVIRAIIPGAAWSQFGALAAAAALLCAVQLALAVRRARHSAGRASSPTLLRRAPPPHNPFVREANQSWTGLVEPPPKNAAPPTVPPKHPPDEG